MPKVGLLIITNMWDTSLIAQRRTCQRQSNSSGQKACVYFYVMTWGYLKLILNKICVSIFFTNWMVDIWNSLPNWVVTAIKE